MKFIITTLALLFLTLNVKADAWDNLTKEEANQVIEYLSENPFVLDYCDCCTPDGRVSLVKVVDPTIETCSWNNEMYSVYYTPEVVAVFKNDAEGVKIKETLEEMDGDDGDGVIYMNYTWTPNLNANRFEPLYNSVSYNYYGVEKKACADLLAYPDPKVVKNRKYKKWYKKAMKA